MSVAKMINNLGVNLARQGQYEKASKYYLMSFAFVATQDLQTRVSFNLGLDFKKWGKLPQAKYWLEKSRDSSMGTFTKTERHLAELVNIVAVAGLGEPSPTPSPAKIFIRDTPPAEDLSFLEEESVSIVPMGQGPTASASARAIAQAKALQNMTSDIDSIVDFDDSLVFDDQI